MQLELRQPDVKQRRASQPTSSTRSRAALSCRSSSQRRAAPVRRAPSRESPANDGCAAGRRSAAAHTARCAPEQWPPTLAGPFGRGRATNMPVRLQAPRGLGYCLTRWLQGTMPVWAGPDLTLGLCSADPACSVNIRLALYTSNATFLRRA